MSTEPHGIADDQVRSAFQRWKNLEEEKARIGDDLKELFAEQKAFGHDTKAMRAAFRLKLKMDEARPEDAEHEALVDTYLAALEAPRASRAYARENIEENRRSDGGLSILTKHEDIRTAPVTASEFQAKASGDNGATEQDIEEFPVSDPATNGRGPSLTTREAEESVVPHSPETAEQADPADAAVTAGDDLREPVAAEQGQIIREGDAPRETDRLGGDASRPDTEFQMDRATEGSFETGSEAAEKGREAIPAGPEGADLSHAGAGESPATEKATVATQGEATAPTSDERVSLPVDDRSDAAANAGGDHVDGNALRVPTSNTGEGAACALPAKSKLRPHCQRPGNTCGGYGDKHCHDCLRAMREYEAA